MKTLIFTMDQKRRADETMAVCRGGLEPCRFWERALISPDEFKALEKQGWIPDTTRFAMDPNDYEIEDRP